ncbi:hypothetical protein CHUAL_007918 [Chamberlinius hualienensis]
MADTLMYGGSVDSNYPYIFHQRNSSFTQTKGLLNHPGQNNCFLNSAVQVLWHLDIFRHSFRETIHHTCVGDNCIFCALKELFTQFQYSDAAALPPDALRKALAHTFINQRRFQLGYMDDAAECFENILMRIHFHITNGKAEDMCNDMKCISHQKFAMTLVEQGICHSCGATSEPFSFTQMVHYISSSTLCAQEKLKRYSTVERFGQLLRRSSEVGDIKDCPSGCGAKIQIQKSLMNRPEIISVGIAWDSERPTLDHIMDVFSTIGTSIQIYDVFHSVVDRKWASTVKHHLVGVVTYYGKHYSTFFFHTKLRMWIYFDDATVRQIGPCWEHVVDKCRRGHFQPLLLLYANLEASAPTSTNGHNYRVTDCHRLPQNPMQQGPRVHGYDFDSDTGYSSADRSPAVVKQPFETAYDYYNTNRSSVGCSPNEQNRKLDPKSYPNTHFNFNFEDANASYHKISDVLPKPSPAAFTYANRNNSSNHQSYDSSAYISRKAVENVLNYQKVCQNYQPPSVQQYQFQQGCPDSPGGQEINHRYMLNRPFNNNINNHSHPVSHDCSSPRGFQTNADISSNQPSAKPLNGPPLHSKSAFGMPKSVYDAGYDSFSLSSNDSFPVNQHYSKKSTDNHVLSTVVEHQQPLPLSNGVTDMCQSLCWEADKYLKQSVDSENVGDFETAINLCNGAAAKARAAMDAPYSNPHNLVLAQRKHNTCIMRARSLHRRILSRQDSINSYSSSTGTETDTVLDNLSVNSGTVGARPVIHSRQSSRDSNSRRSLINHNRQSSRDRSNSNGPSPAELIHHGRQNNPDSAAEKKRIEVYATLPKSVAKKKTLKNAKAEIGKPGCESNEGIVAPTIRDDSFWRNEVSDYDKNGYLSSCESQPQTPKKSNVLLCRANSIPPKLYNNSSSVPVQESANFEDKMAAKVEKNKQHRVRRKCLMGGLLKRKNNSMPDLRDETVPNGNSSTCIRPFEEGISSARSEQNLNNSTNGGSGKVPPPPPVRTTSQLSIRSRSQSNLTNQQEINPAELNLVNYYNHNNIPNRKLATRPPELNLNENLSKFSYAGKNQIPTPNSIDEFDFPPPPSSLLLPLKNNSYEENVTMCKPPPPEPQSPNMNHWLKELQNKQQLLVEKKNFESVNNDPSPIHVINDGNCIKKIVQNIQHTAYSAPASNLQKQIPQVQSISKDLPSVPHTVDYQTRSVRDLANKFERNLNITSNVHSRVNNIAVQIPSQTQSNKSIVNENVNRSLLNSVNLSQRKSPINHPVVNNNKHWQGPSTAKDPSTSVPKEYSYDQNFPNNCPNKNEQRYVELHSGMRPINHLEQSMDLPNLVKHKVKGPKKCVKFSDQIVLVAGADETENLLQNPLFKKVLQKSGSGHLSEYYQQENEPVICQQDENNHLRKLTHASSPVVPTTIAKTLCTLCYKKTVQSTNIYCTDCEFYMSRFKPKR